MKLRPLLYVLPGLLLLCSTASPAQELYQMVFTGTSSTTDSKGVIVTRKTNNQTLLEDYGINHGTTNVSYLALAYHMKMPWEDSLGDTIDIINRTNGTFYDTLIGFYFGEDDTLGRTGLISGSGRQQRRIEYIYTDQNTHSMGSALITNYYWFDTQGNTNNVMAFGQMQWIRNPDNVSTNTQVNTGSFITVKKIKFK